MKYQIWAKETIFFKFLFFLTDFCSDSVHLGHVQALVDHILLLSRAVPRRYTLYSGISTFFKYNSPIFRRALIYYTESIFCSGNYLPPTENNIFPPAVQYCSYAFNKLFVFFFPLLNIFSVSIPYLFTSLENQIFSPYTGEKSLE